MTSLAILHAPGDEAAAQALSGRLQAFRPIALAIGAQEMTLRLGAHVALLVVWSARAQALHANRALGDICVRHDGLVMICALDDAALPEELDDFDYRMIDLSIDEAAIHQAKRAHDIVGNAERVRREAIEAEVARRERTPSGQAFAGGALSGFATTVALFGAMGATAIGAVDQLNSTEDQQAVEAPPSNMRVLRGIPAAPDHSWAEAPLLGAPTQAELAAADITLAEAAARIAEVQAATEPARARLETVAGGELWSPPATRATAPAAAKAPPPQAPVAPREFARAEETATPAPKIEVARFDPFEAEPFDFAPVEALDLPFDADVMLTLDEPMSTELDWSAAALKEISYKPDGRSTPEPDPL